MKKKTIFIIFGIFILLLSCLFFYLHKKNKQGGDDSIKKVCFDNNCFIVELAKTSEEQSYGLMFRESLEEDKGMLFLFKEEGDYSFWMRNTLIPLDIIWIDENQEVVFIYDKAQPCREDICLSVNPDKKARYVLEINAGMAERAGIVPGDKAIFSY